LRSGQPPPDVAIDPHSDLAALPYSSGTTGLPKGVMLTHHNLVANLCQCQPVWDVHEDEVGIAVLPFFHIYGLTVLMALTLWRGATLVTMPRFDLERFLTLLQDYRVTSAALVPPIMLALAKHPLVDRFDLSALQFIGSGAAPLGAELEDDGYVHIVDRVKELIKYKGLQIAPAELEAVLVSHPAIADAAVVRVPDQDAGEVPRHSL
jgi:acyl-CoA synthetase (AMP-forming)/AMP-acid ligase II